MPLYNAGKSALSSFSQSLMLEYESFPRVIDARFGDFKSEFNKTSSKQELEELSARATKAWEQIELQLVESPPPLVAARLIKKAVLRNKSSVIFGGGFFQGRMAPLLFRILPVFLRSKILNRRYFN
jgi:short-subunit dehydrogenase